MELRTARLDLRPWTEDDLAAFHRIWGDPAVIWWGHAEDLDASRAILARVIEQGWLAAVERGSGAIAGNVFLRPASYDDGALELGYHFAKEHQNRGYATEASRALVARGFLDGAARITAIVVPENAPSQRVVSKLGMRRTGQRMHAGLLHDVFEITRP